jgi:uncharacterized small protein (DUF1192 family)
VSTNIDQQISVKIKATLEGLPEVKAFALAVKSLQSNNGSGVRQLKNELASVEGSLGRASIRLKDTEKSLLGVAVRGEGAASVLLSAGSAAAGLGVALTAIGAGAAALGLSAFVAEGIRFNAVIESSKIGIASLVANTYNVKDAAGQLLGPAQAFNASLEEADGLERKLQKSAIETKYEFEDILTFFNSAVVAGAGLNASLDQLATLANDIALVAGAINLPVEKVNTGIKQILTGYTTVRNDLAKAIFPGQTTKQINEQLKTWREQGTLIDQVEKRLQVFRLSGDAVSKSFEALASNVADAFKVFAADSTGALFDKTKQAIGFIIGQIVDLSGESVKLQPTFQKIATIINEIGTFIGNVLLGYLTEGTSDLKSWVDYLYENRDGIESIVASLYTIVEQTGLIAANLLGIVGDVTSAGAQSASWVTVLQYVALTFGLIRDVLNVIVGFIETAIGGLLMVLNPLGYIYDGLNRILDLTDQWFGRVTAVSGALRTVASWIGVIGNAQDKFGTGLFENGYNRASSGLNFQGLYGAQDTLNTPFTLPSSNRSSSPRSFTPKPPSASGADGAAKRARDERVRDARKLFDEIEKYQIANARRDTELNKEANEQVLALWQRRYDQGLESAQDFYNKKQELDLNDLDRQKANLEKEKRFAKQALGRDLGAITGKFQLTPDELQATIDKLSSLDPDALATADNTTIKQATEYVKYLDQTANITQKLTEIEIKRKGVLVGTTNSLADNTRAVKQHTVDLASELADAFNQDGVSDQNNLLKRLSDDFPKILTEFGKGVPGIKEAAEQIRNLGTADLTQVQQVFADLGISFDTLPDQAQKFLAIIERLTFLAKQKEGIGKFTKIQNAFEFDTESASRSFANGDASFGDAFSAIRQGAAGAIKELQPLVDEMQARIDAAAVGIGTATAEDVQQLEKLKRYLDDLKAGRPALALIDAQSNQDATVYSQKLDQIDAQREAGLIRENTADALRRQATTERIAALNEEISRLQALGDKSLETQNKIQAAKNEIAQLANQNNQQLIQFAQGVNGLAGDAISGFINDLIDGTESIGNAFRKLLSSLLTGIAKAIAQAIMLKYVLGPLGLTGGHQAASGGFLGSLVTRQRRCEVR